MTNEIGHSNGMTFNSTTNTVLATGRDSAKKIVEFDADSLEEVGEYSVPVTSSIGYDANHNYYMISSGRRLYVTNNNFEQLYSFDLSNYFTGQDLEYHNGYVYYICDDAGPSSNQLYGYKGGTSRVYAYNAKFKRDGTPEKDFGRLEKVFYNAKKELEKIIAKYSKIEKNIDTIEGGLEKDKLQMLKDITIFDTMYEKNLEYFKEISLYIIAGEKKLAELRETELPKLKAIAEKSGEQLDVQKVNDMEALINRFEKKIYDLKTTRIISIQMAPQIRLLQNNEAELVEKIQSSITNTIPLWKNQMVLALGISNAKNALKSQQAVSKLTNEMLAKNSETLKQGSVEIARESERAIVDVETLQKTNQDIIETLDEVIKIHEEGRNKRAEAEKTLEEIEKELKAKMLEIHVKEK